jgi:hypothetical protein
VLYGYELVTLVELVLLVFCVLNVVTTPEDDVRNLPKLLWLLLVVVLPLVGGIAWLVAGRPATGARRTPARQPRTRHHPASTATSPDDDEAFLRSLRERAEQQRRTSAEQRRRDQAGRDGDDRPV